MTFTKAARILAVLAVVWGILRLSLAILVIMSDDPTLAGRYLGSKTTGQVIDQALYTIVFGILVGVATDISRSLATVRGTKLSPATEPPTPPDPTP